MIKPTAAFYKSGNKDVIRYVSGTTVYEEALFNGYFIGLYWSAANHVHREDFTAQWLPEKGISAVSHKINSFQLEIDGQSLHNRWIIQKQYQQEEKNSLIVVVELKHELRPITVKVFTKLDVSSFLTRWLEITNDGKEPAALSKIDPMSGMLWRVKYTDEYGFLNFIPQKQKIEKPFSLAYIDGIKQSEEGNLKWIDLTEPICTLENLQKKPFGNPYYIVRNNVSGEMFYIALAWSAGFSTSFHYDRIDKLLSFSTGPTGKAPLRVIAPNETVVSPAVHIGPQHSNIDNIVKEWYLHLRNSVIPQRQGKARMYTVAGRVVENPGDWILREIDIAHEMGIEAFMVDAGWYGESFASWVDQRGDWFEGNFLPLGGLRGIRDYAHQKEMLFGLWMEPETIAKKSKIYSEHPEFCGKYETQAIEHLENHTEADLANPKAAKYVSDCIKNIIKGLELDFFKLDYNTETFEGIQNEIFGYAENNSWRHFEMLYGTFKEIRKQNSKVVLENCASGGGRNDLGMLSLFNYCCESDFSQMPLSIRCINSMTLFLPPESICYYHNHIQYAHLQADIDTHLRVCLFALPIFVGFGAQDADRNSIYFQKTKEYIKLAKGFCRIVMENSPIVFHHTPYIGLVAPADFCVLEYACQDKSQGYCGIFKLTDQDQEYRLLLRGIDESKSYEITRGNSGATFVVKGYKLVNHGFLIRLENINSSELILYKQI